FFFSSRRRHTRFSRDWSSDVCSSDLFSQVAIIAILAFGMTFVLMLGEIDLSVGSTLALCGIVLGLMLSQGVNEWVAVAATLLTRSEERRVGKECRSCGWRWR